MLLLDTCSWCWGLTVAVCLFSQSMLDLYKVRNLKWVKLWHSSLFLFLFLFLFFFYFPCIFACLFVLWSGIITSIVLLCRRTFQGQSGVHKTLLTPPPQKKSVLGRVSWGRTPRREREGVWGRRRKGEKITVLNELHHDDGHITPDWVPQLE